LLHSGSDEVKGTHRVTGEVSVVRPDQHVGRSRVSSVFTGTVKNLDKPPELCQRFSEFDGCIGYSLDSVRSLFDDRYNISDSESKDFAYLIGRVPTSEVEGSDSWGDETSLTIGEYNETLSENQDLKEEVDRKVGSIWKTMFIIIIPIGGIIFAFIYFVYPTYERDKSRFSERKLRKIQTSDEKQFDKLTGFMTGGKN